MGKRFVVAVGVGALALGVGGIAFASIPSSGGVFTACVLKNVGTLRLIDPSLSSHDLTSHCVSSLEQQVSWNAAGTPGAPGATGPKGATGQKGATGPQGATGPEGPAELESTRLCTPDLCIDADPGSGGGSGWGWNPSLNNGAGGAVTDLTVGDPASFTVTVVQDGLGDGGDGDYSSTGSITLTWNPSDFTGPTSGNDGTCETASTGNALSCTYTDLAHQYKSVGFTFTPLQDNPDAQVGVTVHADDQEASAIFPVAITG
jgi:hypothetical protein